MVTTKQIAVIGLGAVLFFSAILGAISLSSPQQTSLSIEELNAEVNALVDFCMDTLPTGLAECDEDFRLIGQLCEQVSTLDACTDGRIEEYHRVKSTDQ